MQKELNQPFLYRGCYSYDIPSCHYNILKNSGYDVTHIPTDDKLARNSTIGMMMRRDKKLTKFLRSTTESIIDYYIADNHITEDDLLLRQYDGFYVTRKLVLRHDPKHPAHLEEQCFYDTFLFSICRTMYMGYSIQSDRFLIKGVPNNYPTMIELYKKFIGFNFLSKQRLSSTLAYFKEMVLTSQNKNLYFIPIDEISTDFKVFIKDFGESIVKGRSLNMVHLDEIDRKKYFQIYLEPFFKAIVFQLL